AEGALHPFLGHRRESGKDIIFESEVSAAQPAFIEDHKIHGLVIVPAVGYLEMAMRATRELYAGALGRVEGVAIHQGMIVAPGTTRLLRMTAKPAAQGSYAFEIQSCETTHVKDASAWRVHCTGTLAPAAATAAPPPLATDRLAELQAALSEHLDLEQFYARTHRHGIGLGPDFFVVDRVWRRDVEILAHLDLPTKLVPEMSQYLLHPVFLDSGWQLLATPQAQGKEPRIPMGLGSLVYHDLSKPATWAHIQYDSAPTEDTTVAHVTYYNGDGAVVAAMRGCRSMKVPRQALARLVEAPVPPSWFFELGWKAAAPLPLPARKAGDAPATWLVFNDQRGLGPTLTAALERRGCRAVLVTASGKYRFTGQHAEVDAGARGDFERLLKDVAAAGGPPVAGAVCLWSADPAHDLDMTVCVPALHMTQALAAAKLKNARLWLVTRGAQ
ncbi:MAG TPA: polyketide synthase dehydratase domain-containing protein, partial [Myxococcota bacterium]|nr:polyketide synthase dehydratase domain-containing protein [Myxococcota bacterium]